MGKKKYITPFCDLVEYTEKDCLLDVSGGATGIGEGTNPSTTQEGEAWGDAKESSVGWEGDMYFDDSKGDW